MKLNYRFGCLPLTSSSKLFSWLDSESSHRQFVDPYVRCTSRNKLYLDRFSIQKEVLITNTLYHVSCCFCLLKSNIHYSSHSALIIFRNLYRFNITERFERLSYILFINSCYLFSQTCDLHSCRSIHFL